MTVSNKHHRESRLAFWMLAPTFAVVLAFVVFPVIWNLWISLKPVSLADLRGDALFQFNLSLDNFQQVFSDPDFETVLLTTLVYTIGGSLLSILLGLMAALLVHTEFRGRALLRGLFIAPYIAPVVAVTFTWSFILDPQLGVFNRFAVDHGVSELCPLPPYDRGKESWFRASYAGSSKGNNPEKGPGHCYSPRN